MAVVNPPAKLVHLANLANLVSLPARHFTVVDVGTRRAQVLTASVSRGRPRLRSVRTVDAHEEGYASAEELREDVRKGVREAAPEAVILVLPHASVLRHVLEVPPGDASQTRDLVEKEASRIGGLSESPWAFDSVRLRQFSGLANPVAAVFCRQTDLQELLDGYVDAPQVVFEVLPAGDALAAAFRSVRPSVAHAILVDLGALHTGVTILAGSQVVFSASFPSGSDGFTQALAQDRGCSLEAAEVLKRTEPPALSLPEVSRLRAAVVGWWAEVERTVREWREDHSELAAAAGDWPVVLAGGGALQPGLVEELRALAGRPVEGWPASGGKELGPDQATAWGALLLATGLVGVAPSLLPQELRGYWRQQRFWRGLLSLNLVLSVILGVALGFGMKEQGRLLEEKRQWREAAALALQHARDIRGVAEAFNARLDVMRPVLERQRQTLETLQLLGVLQQQRTNAAFWYVLLADSASYHAGSNDFSGAAPGFLRPVEAWSAGSGVAVTNPPPLSARTYVAEVCLVPQGEEMRRALSELVSDLKRYPLFRNVDVLPTERRRYLVATNLVFPERHFALELSLSEAELLAPIPLPRLVATNREPRLGLRTAPRLEAGGSTNGVRGGRQP